MQDLAKLINEDVFDRNKELSNIFSLIKSMGTGVFRKENVIRRLHDKLDQQSVFYNR